MNRQRIQIAKPDIIKHFEALPQKVFKQTDVAAILTENRDFWRLTQRTSTSVFIQFLTEYGKLKRLDFPFPYRKEVRYTWAGGTPDFAHVTRAAAAAPDSVDDHDEPTPALPALRVPAAP